jgi:4-aminobutyrate aminotransferase/(S)-3-amino-2-methylpropionate transaminase
MLSQGLLMFAPVGMGGGCVKVAPPLSIPEEALRESVQVFEEAVDEVVMDNSKEVFYINNPA